MGIQKKLLSIYKKEKKNVPVPAVGQRGTGSFSASVGADLGSGATLRTGATFRTGANFETGATFRMGATLRTGGFFCTAGCFPKHFPSFLTISSVHCWQFD
jgi:hypothetical protein